MKNIKDQEIEVGTEEETMELEISKKELFKVKAFSGLKKFGKVLLIGGAGFLLGGLLSGDGSCECDVDFDDEDYESEDSEEDSEESTED